MKHMKRFFALLLVFALALGVGVTAAAEEVTAAWQKEDNQSIIYGKDIVLSVEGLIPAEYAGWDVSYEWQVYVGSLGRNDVIARATGPVLQLSRKDAEYPDGKKILGALLRSAQGYYFCNATVRNADGDEVVLPLLLIHVTVKPTWFGDAVNSVLDGLLDLLDWLFFQLVRIVFP